MRCLCATVRIPLALVLVGAMLTSSCSSGASDTTTTAVEAAPTTADLMATTATVDQATRLFVNSAEVFEVTMELLGAEGFATTCGPLLMRLVSEDETSFLRAVLSADGFEGTSVPRLFLAVSDELSWQREHPEPRAGSGFGLTPDECHGGMIEGSTGTEQGILSISVEEGAIHFLWHFDYWREDSTVREHFTLQSAVSPVEWTFADGVTWTTEVTSNFTLTWFLRVGEQLVHDYDLFEGNPRLFHFRITATPRPDIVVAPPEPEAISETAVAFREIWNRATQEFGVSSLVLDNAKAWRDPGGAGGGVTTEWQISTEATSARLKHLTHPNGRTLEVGLYMDSVHDTDPGRLWLQNATRVLIAVMEPDRSDDSAEDLVTRLLASDFGYEESSNMIYIYQGADSSAFILASPLAR